MSNTAELCARLLEHAAIHDRETSPYSPEQAAWAADLRDAAALIQAAPVVERADSQRVVERGAGNMSDNAALAAPAVPPEDLDKHVGRVAVDDHRRVLGTRINLFEFNGLSDFCQEFSTKVPRERFA